jgi:hypothetical protein
VNQNCPHSAKTTLVGTVYDPAGRNPLSGVLVYVPEDPGHLGALAAGESSCVTCANQLSDFVTFTVTDRVGNFELTDLPTGRNVPLVLQIGKWRRVLTVGKVADCATTEIPSTGAGQARLPRNQSEGSMPQMALLTGGCDNVACFLTGIGVDASEFTAPHAGGRVDVYQGLGATGAAAALSNGVAGDCTTPACPLWSSRQSLEAYDAIFLGCECDEHDETKPASSLLAMHDWLGEGGRVFATHSQATWFKNGPSDFKSIAGWTSGPASGVPGPFTIDTTFQGGMDMLAWLGSVGVAGGVVPLDPADVSTSVTAVASPTDAWITDGSPVPDGGGPSGHVAVLTAGTPVADPDVDSSLVPAYCGRVTFFDVHPGGGQALQASSGGSSAPAPVPAACGNGPLSAAEKVLEYLFFDEPICLPGDFEPPPPPLTGG